MGWIAHHDDSDEFKIRPTEHIVPSKIKDIAEIWTSNLSEVRNLIKFVIFQPGDPQLSVAEGVKCF